jgi:hypothetical protein
VSAKAKGHLKAGISYVLETVYAVNPVGFVLAALAVVGIWRIARRPTPLGILVVTAAFTESAFVVLSGGDWMEGGRFLVVLAALVSILAAVALAGASIRTLVTGGACALIALQIVGMVRFARSESTGTPIWASPLPLASSAQNFEWVERQNRVHLRDTLTIAPLERVIKDLQPHVAGRITIASGQGGMVAYYVFRKAFGQLTFIDLADVATDTFMTRCPQLLDPGKVGSRVHYADWLATSARCDVPKPDIIVDVFDFRLLGSDQYVAVHQDDGNIGSSSSLLPGETISLVQFIAVRRDLAQYIPPGHRDP